MRRWLVTGAGGMVGHDVVAALHARDEEVVGLTRAELDICDGARVLEVIAKHRPTIIINCAAYTRVDDAESNENLANAINGSAVEFLALAASRQDALLTQISTDYAFDGSKREPYEVTDPPSPASVYGRSKVIGEHAAQHATRHLIVRTSWLFGVHGPNFVATMRNLIARGTNPLRVVNDQYGRPTYTPHLAAAVIRLAQLASDGGQARGIVHYADEGACSWFEFTQAILEELGNPVDVVPVSTAEFPRPAPRPAYSVLSTERYERLTGVQPESWRDGLREYLSLTA